MLVCGGLLGDGLLGDEVCGGVFCACVPVATNIAKLAATEIKILQSRGI
jgi:hypothetical protein